jgi:hypothetical protein
MRAVSAIMLLKLGGSLITDESTPYVPRLDKLPKFAGEVQSGVSRHRGIQLLLGRGSGSFGITLSKNLLSPTLLLHPHPRGPGTGSASIATRARSVRVSGDIAFDLVKGTAILSTEMQMFCQALRFKSLQANYPGTPRRLCMTDCSAR